MKHLALILMLLVLPHLAAAQAPLPSPGSGDDFSSVEERRLLSALQQERTDLEQQRMELEERKKDLKRIEAEVDKKLDQLTAMRLRLEEMLAEKDERELQRVKDLSKMYEKMSADQAAGILAALEQELAIAILENMKTKAAARILNNLDREKAAALTAAFSTLEPQ